MYFYLVVYLADWTWQQRRRRS